MQPIHGGPVQPVALFNAVRDVADHPAAPLPEKFREQTGGGDAVHVVIPVNGNDFPALQRPADARGGPIHVPHEKRVMEQLGAVGKKCPSLCRGVQPAGAQHSGAEGGQARQLHLTPGGGRAARAQIPLFILHSIQFLKIKIIF